MVKFPDNKISFIALCASILIIISSTFILYNLDHDCSGEDCPICLCIEFSGIGFISFTFLIYHRFLIIRMVQKPVQKGAFILFALKVRLNT
ncbi:hypothetical protein FACS1894172_03510 [Spirochaetia bacterium]|nr:hypothetical protein FACS1894172_03510 [Spirochaetia bacterium]